MGKTIYLLAIALLCAGLFAQSSDISVPQPFQGSLLVNKSAASSANLGGTITVTITVSNNGSSAVSALVEETLGNVQPVEPQPKHADVPSGQVGARPPYISWTLDIPAGGEKSVSYTIKPLNVGFLDIGPTSVSVDGAKFYSNSLQIDVACSSSPGCDDSIGETPLTCPQKCGGNPNTTVEGPAFVPQPEPSQVVAQPDTNALANDKGGPIPPNLVLPVIVIIVVFVAAGAYMLFIRKKK